MFIAYEVETEHDVDHIVYLDESRVVLIRPQWSFLLFETPQNKTYQAAKPPQMWTTLDEANHACAYQMVRKVNTPYEELIPLLKSMTKVVCCKVVYFDGKTYNVAPDVAKKVFHIAFDGNDLNAEFLQSQNAIRGFAQNTNQSSSETKP